MNTLLKSFAKPLLLCDQLLMLNPCLTLLVAIYAAGLSLVLIENQDKAQILSKAFALTAMVAAALIRDW